MISATMLRRWTGACAAALMVIASTFMWMMPAAEAATVTATDGDFKFTYDSLNIPAGATITEWTKTADQVNLTIPASLMDGATSVAVVAISDGAFGGKANLTGTLTIAASIESIGDSAFYGANLTGTLAVPASVKTIEDLAFFGNDLTGVTFADDSLLTTIGYRAFAFNGRLTGALALPKSLTHLGAGAFLFDDLTGVSFAPDTTLAEISDEAFAYNSKLAGSLEVPDSVTRIGLAAFRNGKLTGLSFGATSKLEIIGNAAFAGNRLTGDLTLPNGLTSIGDEAFRFGNKLDGDLVIPDAVTTVGEYAFSMQDFATLTLGSGLTSIGREAFYGIPSLTGTLMLPASLTTIGRAAFGDAGVTELAFAPESTLATIGDEAFASSKLTGSVTFPDSVTSIGGEAFAGTELTEITFATSSNLASIGNRAFYGIPSLTGTLTLPASLTTIGRAAFVEAGVTGLAFAPESTLATIGDEAFASSKLTGSVTFPDSVTSIGGEAFAQAGLTGITFSIHSNLASIGGRAFSRNFLLRVRIPASVTSIGYAAFAQNGMTDLSFDSESSLVTIGDQAFIDNALIGVLVIPASVETIGYASFYDAFDDAKASSLVFAPESSLTSIGEQAFGQNTRLTGSIAFPDSLTTIGREAFIDNDLTGVSFGSSLISINQRAFALNRITGNLEIPSTTVSVGEQAFLNNNITTLVISWIETRIGTDAFAGNPSLTPFVSSITPATGSAAGGTRVTVTGGRFGAGATVTFAGVAAREVSVALDGKSITATTPPGVAGAAAVVVRNPWLNSSDGSTRFTYQELPAPPGEQDLAPVTTGPDVSPTSIEAPNLTPGQVVATVNGLPLPVRVLVAPDRRSLRLSTLVGSVTIGTSLDGNPLYVTRRGTLVLAPSGELALSGSGLLPGSPVTVTIFSTPTQIAQSTVTVGGTYALDGIVPATMPLGSHTMVLSGVTNSGEPMSLSLGVDVLSSEAAVATYPRLTIDPGQFTVGKPVTLRLTGAQSRCTAQVTATGIEGRDVRRVKIGPSGRARITLVPMKTGRQHVTVAITGVDCSPTRARTSFTVRSRWARSIGPSHWVVTPSAPGRNRTLNRPGTHTEFRRIHTKRPDPLPHNGIHAESFGRVHHDSGPFVNPVAVSVAVKLATLHRHPMLLRSWWQRIGGYGHGLPGPPSECREDLQQVFSATGAGGVRGRKIPDGSKCAEARPFLPWPKAAAGAPEIAVPHSLPVSNSRRRRRSPVSPPRGGCVSSVGSTICRRIRSRSRAVAPNFSVLRRSSPARLELP
jgi:hypothetical protein